ncbi:MAG: NADH-quinone oxidoreductase subunit H [Cyclobacteriaceae bacterium]
MIPLLLIFITAFFFPGIIGKTKAIFSGRKGASVLQPYRDILKLFRKGSVYSENSTLIFQFTIPVYIAGLISAILVLPFGTHPGFISFEGDFVFFGYMMALSRFMMIIGALDTASGFEGMGANREAFYSMLIEPAFFVLLGTLAMFTGFDSFYDIFANLHYTSYFSILVAVIATYLLAQICLVENSRLPVDDPKTHLELTMVHEVMILDHSGFDLALIHIGNALKFGIFGLLIANCVIHVEWSPGIVYPLYFLTQVLFAVAIAIVESFRARNKMAFNPQYIINLSAISLLLIFVILIINNNL